MRIKIFALLLLFTATQVVAQNAAIDSLNQLYNASSDQKEKILLKCQIAQAHTEIGNFDKGGQLAENALQEAITLKDKKGTGVAYYSLARLSQYMRAWDKALTYHYQAVQLLDEANAQEELAWSYLNMGIAFDAKADYKRANRYDSKALEIFKKIDHKQGTAYSYLNLGAVVHRLGKTDEAFKQLEKAKEICLKIGDQRGVGYVYNISSSIHLRVKNWDKAIADAESCIVIRTKENDKRDLAFLHGVTGEAYLQKGQFAKATTELKKAEKYGLEIPAYAALKTTYESLARLDSAKGNFKGAFEYIKKHNLYVSLLNEEVKEGIEVAYDYERKQLQKDLSDAELKSKEESAAKIKAANASASQAKNISYGAIGAAVLIALVALVRARKKK